MLRRARFEARHGAERVLRRPTAAATGGSVFSCAKRNRTGLPRATNRPVISENRGCIGSPAPAFRAPPSASRQARVGERRLYKREWQRDVHRQDNNTYSTFIDFPELHR